MENGHHYHIVENISFLLELRTIKTGHIKKELFELKRRSEKKVDDEEKKFFVPYKWQATAR